MAKMPEPTFGERLREIRQKRQMTQESVGIKLGVSRTTVSSWEEDISRPRFSKIVALVQLFNVSYDHLFVYDNKDQNESVNEFYTTVGNRPYSIHDLVEIMRNAEPQEREQIAKAIILVADDEAVSFAEMLRNIKLSPRDL